MRYGTGLPSLVLKIRNGTEQQVLADLRKIWKKVNPDSELDYSFLEDTIRRLYSNEDRMFVDILSGSALAVLISFMGVFALSYFLVETKTKEIAVRKVLGSSASGIIRILSRDLLKMLVVANVLAWPAAYFVVRNWLQNYAYRVRIDFFVFPVVGGIILALALTTVATKSRSWWDGNAESLVMNEVNYQ